MSRMPGAYDPNAGMMPDASGSGYGHPNPPDYNNYPNNGNGQAQRDYDNNYYNKQREDNSYNNNSDFYQKPDMTLPPPPDYNDRSNWDQNNGSNNGYNQNNGYYQDQRRSGTGGDYTGANRGDLQIDGSRRPDYSGSNRGDLQVDRNQNNQYYDGSGWVGPPPS